MNRLELWVLGVALGIAAVLSTALMFWLAIAVALLVVPLARRRGGLAALSGECIGFGALWLALLVRQSTSGGTLDNAAFWAAFGIVPLAVGLALLVELMRRRRLPGSAS